MSNKRPDVTIRNKLSNPMKKEENKLYGNKNVSWKGNSVKYRGLHAWLNRHFPKQNKCFFCGKENAKVYDWANVTGVYDRNIENYCETCRGCHLRLDRWNSLLFTSQP